MKQIILVLALLPVFVSCGSRQETTDAESAEPTAKEQPAAQLEKKDTVADAVTGATAVVNPQAFNGIIIVPPQKNVTVTMTMGGTVNSMSMFPGEYVKKGQVIATLKNPEFISLQQEYLDASSQLEFLEKEFVRQQNLSSQEAASQKRLQQSKAEYQSMKSKVDAAAAQLKLLGVNVARLKDSGISPYLEIKAPISGYVTNMNGNVGKYFNVGDPICDVIDKGALLLELTAYEKDLDKLKIGDEFDFQVNGVSGKTYKATLMSIDQRVDDKNRSVKIYLRIKNPGKDFRPGMYVYAEKIR